MFDPIPINTEVPKRKTKWIQVCPLCQQERIVSYAQAWNLSTGRSHKECKRCCIEKKLIQINTEGLKYGRKYHPRKAKYKGNKTTFYRDIFDHPSKKLSVRKKMSEAKLGLRDENCNAYIDGRSKINQKLRRTVDYKIWRSNVLKKNNYECQICFETSNLHVHHMKSWSKYPELRLEISNGVTLCQECHKDTHRMKHG